MGCITKRPSNGWNFITAHLANNVTVSDLANTISYCSLTLDAPSSLVAIASSASQIDLSWISNSDGSESGFGIERSIDGIVFVQTDTVGTGISIYSDTGLNDGTKYYYQIRALGAIPSAYSNIADATTALDFGLAMNFDGVNDYAPIANLSGVTMPENLVMQSWVNFEGVGEDGSTRIIFRSGDGAQAPKQLQMRVGNWLDPTAVGKIRVGVFLVNSFAGAVPISEEVDLDSNWHLLTTSLSKEGTDLRVNIFFDDALILTNVDQPYSTSMLNLFADSNVLGNATHGLDASIDNFMLYDSTYTLADQQAEWNNGNGSKHHESKTRLVQFDMDTPTAVADGVNTGLTTLTDQSGNSRDATLTNFALTGTTSNYVDSVSA